jgi:chorismate mutase
MSHRHSTEPPAAIQPHAPSLEAGIGAVRGQIDHLDKQIAALIVQRCALSAGVVAAKQAAGDHAFGWRPAREHEILQKVMQAQPGLDPQLAFVVWRALMSANLAAQGGFDVVSVAATQHQAHKNFSVGANHVCVEDCLAALEAVAAKSHAIALLPSPTALPWWVDVVQDRFAHLHICAADMDHTGAAPALMVCARPPEPAGADDITLIAGPSALPFGEVIAEAAGHSLTRIQGAYAQEWALPQGCRVLGTYGIGQ